jgi:chromosome segregation ATPase
LIFKIRDFKSSANDQESDSENPQSAIRNSQGCFMTIMNDCEMAQGGRISSPRVKMRILQQMAEALEDQAGALYRRAAAYEEEEFLLNHEITERQTEINRLLLKLEAMRSERDGLLGKIEDIRNEAAAMREEAFNSEEEIALAALDHARVEETLEAVGSESVASYSGGGNGPQSPAYFRRMALADAR